MEHAKFQLAADEFVRYASGRIAFCVDFDPSSAARSPGCTRKALRPPRAGFFGRANCKLCLSVRFVSAAPALRRRRVRPRFFCFSPSSAGRLGLTEAGMYAGTELLRLHYIAGEGRVTAVVLIWNYWQEILVFR